MPEYIGNKLVQKAMIRMSLPYTASGVTVVSSGFYFGASQQFGMNVPTKIENKNNNWWFKTKEK